MVAAVEEEACWDETRRNAVEFVGVHLEEAVTAVRADPAAVPLEDMPGARSTTMLKVPVRRGFNELHVSNRRQAGDAPCQPEDKTSDGLSEGEPMISADQRSGATPPFEQARHEAAELAFAIYGKDIAMHSPEDSITALHPKATNAFEKWMHSWRTDTELPTAPELAADLSESEQAELIGLISRVRAGCSTHITKQVLLAVQTKQATERSAVTAPSSGQLRLLTHDLGKISSELFLQLP